MTAMSDYLENELLDHALGTGAFTAPSGTYVQLHTGVPGETGANNVSAETTRQAATWAAASGGVAQLSADLTWSNWSAGPETITHISIWDAASAGNCLFTGALSASKAIVNTDDLVLDATNTSITFD
ncbi:MAG: hypothetical protein AAGA42_11270 [Actinomycetota bacterium]